MAQNALELYKRIKNDPELQSQTYSLDDAGNLYDASGNRMGGQPQPQEQGFNRANFLPLVEYPDGRVEFGLPNILAAPLEGLQNFGRYGYDTSEAISDNARSAFDVAGSMATGSLAATPLKPSNALAAMGSGKGIRAYHGSPYDFDKFDINKIGTGEGAQAYGHGLYFAENENVAKGYRDDLSGGGSEIYLNDTPYNDLPYPMQNALLAYDTGKPTNKHLELLENRAKKDPEYWNDELNAYKNLLEGISTGSLKYERKPFGHMYEVNLKADPEQFLSWDKPLKDQPKQIQSGFMGIKNLDENNLRERAKELLKQNPNSGEAQFYIDQADYIRDITSVAPSEIADRLRGERGVLAAKTMREAGIPGIKYLDGISRNIGEGTHNYVVFDPNIIEILRKYMNPPTSAIVPFATQSNALENR